VANSLWLPPKNLPGHQSLVDAGYDELTARILVDRGIDTIDKAIDFTDPYLGQIHKPALLPDIIPATALVKQAIKEGWPVRLITDYDVDGQTSGALFCMFLQSEYATAGHSRDLIDCITPNRFSEGYGLNQNHILGASLDGKKLVITFDCGIRSHAEGSLARDLGLHLIITDHHEPDGETIPLADAVVNPKRHDSRYPFRDICGCVIALKLAWAVGGSLRKLMPYFDMAAVATVCDMMPTLDENRAILHYGLQVLNGEAVALDGEDIYPTQLPAFIALLGQKTVLETDIGFKIGPPLNALGRMGDANRGIRFLMETNPTKIQEYMVDIQAENELRKQLQQQVINEVCATIDFDNPPPAIVFCSDFQSLGENADKAEGVVGVAAAKVGEQFHAPTVVLVERRGIAKGSGRAVIPLDLHDALHQINHLLIRWGGHHAAAGLSLKTEHVPALREHLTRVVAGVSQEHRLHQHQVDAVITGQDLIKLRAGYPLLEKLDTLRPFGKGNPEPLLLIHNVRVLSSKSIKDIHLKLQLEAEGVTFECISWRGWQRYIDAGKPEALDVLGTVSLNGWSKALQFTIEDFREKE
jgi:single-stranded-DNA-specific exonuclease